MDQRKFVNRGMFLAEVYYLFQLDDCDIIFVGKCHSSSDDVQISLLGLITTWHDSSINSPIIIIILIVYSATGKTTND